jgi:hypothetical protein
MISPVSQLDASEAKKTASWSMDKSALGRRQDFKCRFLPFQEGVDFELCLKTKSAFWRLFLLVSDGFDVVAIRIQHIRREVVWIVFRG